MSGLNNILSENCVVTNKKRTKNCISSPKVARLLVWEPVKNLGDRTDVSKIHACVNALIFFYGVLFLFSCNRSSFTAETIIDIKVNSSRFELCDLIDDFIVVDLEVTEESLLGRIERVIIFNDKIYVHDPLSHSIFIFDYPSGEYIFKISARGRGPGEYLRISSFNVNSENKIEILDASSKKILRFDENGNFIESKYMQFSANDFKYFNEERNIIFTKNSFEQDLSLNYEIVITDNYNNILETYLEVSKFTSTLIKQDFKLSVFNENIVSFLPINSPVVYHIEDSLVVQKYHINFGKNWNTDFFYTDVNDPRLLDELANRKKLVTGLSKIETDCKLLICFWYDSKYNISLFDKKNKFNYLITSEIINKNDFFLKGVFNDYFIFAVREHSVSNISQFCKLENLYKEEFENPSLIIIKFK